jgi:NAD(P)H-hydrate repair Nnr-like enzyme with NAD(P)H-hydrate dehydratase domain
MSLLVVGTFPGPLGEVLFGPVERDGPSTFAVGGRALPACQGTAAMLAAAEAVTRHLRLETPQALLGGDHGRGEGTRAVHAWLAEHGERVSARVVAFHYLQPIMALMRRSVEALSRGDAPLLVADAGGMYAAKAAGLARRFELMTPDVGEVGFLADDAASHPAYVSRYLFGAPEFDPVRLARLAWERGGSPRVLLVKGAVDHVAVEGEIVATVAEPCVPELEPIGGTGDTITGIAAALVAAGFPTVDAAVCAARANREAGRRMGARPDHRATDLVAQLPGVLAERLCGWAGVCPSTAEG